jgi:phosphoribosylformylglycinamidine (FGAM) synthase PurS component
MIGCCETQVEKICDTLLANPNTEHYSFELEKVDPA